jgi:hypothetical protein
VEEGLFGSAPGGSIVPWRWPVFALTFLGIFRNSPSEQVTIFWRYRVPRDGQPDQEVSQSCQLRRLGHFLFEVSLDHDLDIS